MALKIVFNFSKKQQHFSRCVGIVPGHQVSDYISEFHNSMSVEGFQLALSSLTLFRFCCFIFIFTALLTMFPSREHLVLQPAESLFGLLACWLRDTFHSAFYYFCSSSSTDCLRPFMLTQYRCICLKVVLCEALLITKGFIIKNSICFHSAPLIVFYDPSLALMLAIISVWL